MKRNIVQASIFILILTIILSASSDLPNTSIDQTSIACAYGIGALAEDEFGSECSVI